MKQRIIAVLLLLSTAAFAQDPPQLDTARMQREVGDLYLQVSAYREWVVSLQARIKTLETENAKLKAGTKE